ELSHNADGDVYSLGVFPSGASKGNALGSLLRRLKVSQSEVMAIGDDLNDLPMFACAGIKVAMGNAQAQLKEQATLVAPSNDEEGVAWALTKFGVVS
ncbi:MAG TPA: HAD-IIB family hydrolase, partial [Dehalococcoidales bacterium]|nr:HAD-IIB family hydrolase [Dehalococcoidales bacterium]